MISVDVNADDVLAGLDKLADTLKPTVISQAIVPYLKAVQSTARREHRYNRQTGNLERSVKLEINQDGGSVYIDEAQANYGKYIHNGFKSWSPDPFLSDAANANQPQLAQALDREIGRAIQQAGL